MRVVIMGVTGSGKTTVARTVAANFGWDFADADDLHPAANIAKMAVGTALTDEDRWPWLDAVGAWLADHEDAVIACSALRRAYRDRLRAAAPGTTFVHLAAQQSVLAERVALRLEAEGHFAGPALLASQFATLEPLGFDEPGGTVDVSHADAHAASLSAAEIVSALDR